MFEFITQNPLLFHILIAFASLVILVKAADLAVYGISEYAKKLGLSDYIVGLVIVSFAASMPELVSSITGAAIGESGVILGTILGSNIAGLTLVLGLLALVGRKVSVKCKILEKSKMLIFFLSVLPFILMLDGVISRLDGAILVFAFIYYILHIWKKEGQFGKIKKDVKLKGIVRHSFIFVGCLAAILLSARWLVFSSVQIASLLNVTPYVIALIVIGIGASMPDITVGIRSVLRGHKDIGVGDAIGSLLIKLLLFLGVLALINPIVFDASLITTATIATFLCIFLALNFMKKGEMTWQNGLLFVMIYIGFIVVELLF